MIGSLYYTKNMIDGLIFISTYPCGIDSLVNNLAILKNKEFYLYFEKVGSDVVSNKEDMNNIFKKVIPQDLVKYGIVPELVGRLPLITVLDELDEWDSLSFVSFLAMG